MIYAKQSTAIIVTVGPVLDASGVAVTDGVAADFTISKNGAAPGALNGSATLTHRAVGFYSLSLTATDVNTVGTVEIVINDTVNACPMKEIQVVETTIYDALFADTANGFSGAVGASTVTFANTSIATVTTVTNQLTAAAIATGVWQDSTAGDFTTASSIGKALYIANIVPGASGGHFIAGSNAGTTTFGALTVTGATTLTGAVTGTNASNDLRINGLVPGAAGGLFIAGTNAATAITTALTANIIGNITGNLSGSVGTVTTVNGLAANVITAAATAADFGAEVAAAVWQDAVAGDFTVASSIGKALYTGNIVPGAAGGHFIAGSNAATSITTALTANIIGNITGTLATVTTLTNLPSITANWLTAAGTAADFGAEIADAVWDEAIAGHLGAGSTGAALNAAGSAGDPWNTALPGAYGAGTAGRLIGRSLPDIVAGSAGGLFIAGSNADTTVDITGTWVGNIAGDINHVSGSVFGDVVGSVGSVIAMQPGAITASAFAAGAIDAAALAADAVAEIWGTALTEAYRATGATGTAAQLLYEINQHLGEFANSGTTKTVKKLDGVTTAKTYTYDDANTPTSITEAT